MGAEVSSCCKSSIDEASVDVTVAPTDANVLRHKSSSTKPGITRSNSIDTATVRRSKIDRVRDGLGREKSDRKHLGWTQQIGVEGTAVSSVNGFALFRKKRSERSLKMVSMLTLYYKLVKVDK